MPEQHCDVEKTGRGARCALALLIGFGLAYAAFSPANHTLEDAPRLAPEQPATACAEKMLLGQDGKCHYYPPERQESAHSQPQDGWSPIDNWRKPDRKGGIPTGEPKSRTAERRPTDVAIPQLLQEMDHSDYSRDKSVWHCAGQDKCPRHF